jgi:Cu+-exporting ATPase
MTVDRFKTAFRTEHGGTTYFFCGAGCKGKFDADPELYLDPSRRPAPAKAHAGHGH